MKKSLSFFSFLLIAFYMMLALSCRLGKNYSRPQVPLPEKFDRQAARTDSSSVADLPWKNYFGDSTLQTLIDSGLARNYDLQYAVSNIAIAQAQLRQAKWLWYPQLNTAVSGTYFRNADNGPAGIHNGAVDNHYFDYVASLNTSWEIDIWGRFSRQREASLAGYLQSYEAAKAVQTRLVADIAEAYFSLLMLDQQLLQAKKTLALNTDFVKLTRLLYDAGEVSYLAVQQAESQQLSTAQLVPQIAQSIQVQENGLQLLTGSLPGPVSRTSTLTGIHFNDSLTTGLPVAILDRRPDVRADELALVRANALVGVAQANLYPALTLTAGTGFESLKASNWFNIPASVFGLVGGTLVQPILQGRQRRTQYEIARQQRVQAVINFRRTVLTASIEVSNSLIDIATLREQENIARQRTDTLSAAVNNARLLFQNDMANYLEVITAQQTALEAELSLAFVQRAELNARVELYRALGGGWK